MVFDIKGLQKSFDIFKKRLSNVYTFNNKYFNLNQNDRELYLNNIMNIINIGIFLKEQIKNKKIIPLEEYGHYHTSDIHGDLIALGFVLLKSGLANFVKNENPIIFLNKLNGDIIKDIITYKGKITIDFIPILNLEVNDNFNGVFTFGGDILDRGKYSESCYYTYIRLIQNNKKKKIYFIIGNHETPALELKKNELMIFDNKLKNPLLLKMNPYLEISDLKLQSRNLMILHSNIQKNVKSGKIIFCLALSKNVLISHVLLLKKDIEILIKKLEYIIYINEKDKKNLKIIKKIKNLINIFQKNKIIEKNDINNNLIEKYKINNHIKIKNIEYVMNEFLKNFHSIVKNCENFLKDEIDYPHPKIAINGSLKYFIDEKTKEIIPIENRIFNPITDMISKKTIIGHEETPRYNKNHENDVFYLTSSKEEKELLYTDVRQSCGYLENRGITNATFIYSKNIGKLDSYKQISLHIVISSIPKYIETNNKKIKFYKNNISKKIIEKKINKIIID